MPVRRLLDDLFYDARYALRSLLKAPGFSAITILTLALSTGATTAIFSIVHGVLLSPLPFASPDRLVQVEEIGQIGGPGPVLVGDVEEFRTQSRTLEVLSAYSLTTRHLQGAGEPERLTTVVVDHHFFSLLGVRPLIGRTPERADATAVVVIGERLWERRFNRDPSVVGRTIVLDGNMFDPVQQRSVIQRREHTVVGVMPSRFQFPYGAASVYATALPETQIDLWMLNDQPYRGGRVPVTARLRPGVTVAQALSELTVIEQRLDQARPSQSRPIGVRVMPLIDEVVGPVRRALWLLLAAVALVLVAACANVANLLLARTAQRSREVVTRAALGAGRGRLMRQLFTESVLLSVAGGLAGMLIAWWGVRVLIAIGAAKIPRAHEIQLDWNAFAFMMAISLVTSAVFGLAPAVTASRADVHSVTKGASGHATTSRSYGRIRDALVIGEIALAFILALGAALVIRELERLQRQDPGFRIENVITLHITPRVEESQYYRLEERIAQVPDVESAGLVHMVPLQNWGGIGTFQVRGRPVTSVAEMPTAELRSVTPRYFETLRVAMRRGRGLTEQDRLAQPRPIVVNETLARQYFPGEDPIGRALDRGVIVGVVADVRQRHLDETVMPQIYSSIDTSSGIASDIGVAVLVRTRGAPTTSIDAIRAAIRELQPAVAIFNIKTMRQIVDESMWELNLYRWLIGLFAALALVITAIGLFGVISYGATARAREFAIRMALGSDQSRLARVVLIRGITLTVIGLALGGVSSVAVLQLLAAFVAANRPDPLSVASICALLLVIAVAACLWPAIRVARIDPVKVLRQE
jgi:putative ABC transport system permease protein